MLGASKILTVSYGTFSCTLEGFDEPFNTMKAIAEYFRDLAAEDRYFGAEPPTPDAAMLHRIAEREIQRRVEAKIQDNGVILRAGDAEAPALAAPAATTAPAVSAAPAPDANGESVAARLSRLRAAQAAAVAQEPTVQEPALLQPMIATIAEVATAPAVGLTAEAAALADEGYSEDQHADEILANIAALAAPEADLSTIQDQADVLIADGVATDPQSASEPVSPSQDLADLAALDAVALNVPAETRASGAEDLGYDEDLALQNDTSADLAAIFSDDLPSAQSLIAAEAAVIETAPIEAPVFDALTEDTAAAEDAPTADEYDEEILADLLPEHDPIAEAATNADEEMLASLGALITDSDQSQADQNQVDTGPEPLIAVSDDASNYDDAEDDILLASLPVEPQVVAATQPIAETHAPLKAQTQQTNPEDPAPADLPGEKIQRARARVIKIRRADAPRAADSVPAKPQTSLLSPEAEAALQAELAALEAESPAPVATPIRPARPLRHLTPRAAQPGVVDDDHLAAALADDPVAASTAKSDELAQPPHLTEARKLLHTESDDAVERLMAATNSVMDDEDSRRRHSAISHLKAAVAATEAERQINAAHPGRVQPDRQDIYRHDLESVVRAKPVDGSIESRAAANAERLTPLVLVSEQRIDRAKPAAAPLVLTPLATPAAAPAAARVVMPVRPRRVSGGTAAMAAMQTMAHEDSLLGDTGDDLDEEDLLAEDEGNFFVEGQNFADFAEKLGANSLADLLEASAVYCTQVLGREQFSRPLVMRQLEALIDQPDHQREDRLRAFGTLLRQGRIAKIKRGQFALTETSPLLAEALRFTA